jgi:nucleotide-binding universal stress UspA family protein
MKTQIKSILIPTDFSALSESALKMGIAIAKRQNSDITLLHVIDRYSYLQPTEVFLPEVQLTPDFENSLKEKLKEMAGKIQKETGVIITDKVMYGLPADSICQFAFENNTSLIVMGTHGTSGLREFFIGSEAFRVVKNATCPVLTIPGNWQKTNFEKVLFPIRLIEGATDKYFFARPIIERNNSELILLGLTEKKKPGDIGELLALIDKLKMQLHNDKVSFQLALCPCENFSAKVFEMVKEYDTDLIIITANIEYDFKSYFIGPFEQKVVNHSSIPVLSVKSRYDQSGSTKTLEQLEEWAKSIDFNNIGE